MSSYIMVSGSRTWTDRAAILRAFQSWWLVQEEAIDGVWTPTLISGHARGADQLAESVALELGWRVVTHIPDWDRHGKQAGVIRNLTMLDQNPVHVFIFWDGESRGTKHVIDTVQRRFVSYEIHKP